MRSGLLAVAVMWLAGACSKPAGLEVTFDTTADPMATKVAVYIGGGTGTDASITTRVGIAGASIAGKFFPDVHYGVEVFDLTEDPTPTLSLARGTGPGIVSIVAVGFTGDGPTSVATQMIVPINTDVVLVWKIALQPLRSNADTGAPRSVETWGEKLDDHTCVRVFDRSPAKDEPANIFIGTEGDRDCDGIPYKTEKGEINLAECDDDWYRSSVTASIKTLSCMEEQSILTGAGDVPVCMIGAKHCTDGMPGENVECDHQRAPFCAPDALCAQCPSGSVEERLECALGIDPRSFPQRMPFARCEIQSDQSGQLCEQLLYAETPMGWLDPTTVCAGTPHYRSKLAGSTWATGVTIGGIRIAVAVQNETGLCKIHFAPQESGPRVPSEFPQHGLLAIDLVGSKGFVAPVVFDYRTVSTCPTATTRPCDVQQAPAIDSINRCVKRPLSP